MPTHTKSRGPRLAALAICIGLLGMGAGLRAQHQDPDEVPAADARDEPVDTTDESADRNDDDEAGAQADDAPADDADDANDADDADPSADAGTDTDTDTDADVEPDDPQVADDTEDGDSDDAMVADEFMPGDWAPDVPMDPADDAVQVDRTLDPGGQGWVVVTADAPSGSGSRPRTQPRRGDYAGPSVILDMRPRPRGSSPPSHGRDDDRDTAYSYGGQPIAPGSAPWQAQIYRSLARERPGVPLWKAQHNCGGTLIAPDWILTAAHCVDDIIDDRDAGWRVRLGARDLARDEGVTYAVDRWVRHSGYRNVAHPKPPAAPAPPPNMYSNDIALVHIRADAQTKPLQDPSRVRPIVLYRKPVRGDDPVTAIGWGMTENTAKSFSAVPLKVDLRVMDTPVCQSRPGYGPERIGTTVICAAREGQKTCRGDSGGPVILTNGAPAQLVGLVSWGKNDCSGDGKPSVFTRVETYLAWIDQAMRVPETRGSLP